MDKEANNRVRFTSEVIVLTFHGVTERIDGYLYWEGEPSLPEGSQFRFEVDLNSIETGIGKRDRDMREVLETGKWPFTTFEGTLATVQPIDSLPDAYRVMGKGKMFIHGVEREIQVPGTVILEPGRIRVVAEFKVRLEDYEIQAPSLAAFVKVSQEVLLEVDFGLKEFEP